MKPKDTPDETSKLPEGLKIAASVLIMEGERSLYEGNIREINKGQGTVEILYHTGYPGGKVVSKTAYIENLNANPNAQSQISFTIDIKKLV
ncbi:hypothetical protein HZA39_01445 [Candidatus Peregrinibacteria bacterium]|nr:hypothetical protein [Candidatus Peregrinibacteria bacterium]